LLLPLKEFLLLSLKLLDTLRRGRQILRKRTLKFHNGLANLLPNLEMRLIGLIFLFDAFAR